MRKLKLIEKINPMLRLTRNSILVVAVVLISATTSLINAQVFSDLDNNTQIALIQAFESQMDLLRQEALDPQPGVSTESNKNIFYYYENVLKTFQSENVTLREAFISELIYLQKGPVGNHKLTRAIFYRSIAHAPPADRSDLFPGSSSETIAQNGGGNSGSDSALLSLFFQTRENFRSLIDSMYVSSNNISALEAMFTYINNNK